MEPSPASPTVPVAPPASPRRCTWSVIPRIQLLPPVTPRQHRTHPQRSPQHHQLHQARSVIPRSQHPSPVLSLFFLKLLRKQTTHGLLHIIDHVPGVGASRNILTRSAVVVVEDFVGVEALASFVVYNASRGHAFPHPCTSNNISALPGIVLF